MSGKFYCEGCGLEYHNPNGCNCDRIMTEDTGGNILYFNRIKFGEEDPEYRVYRVDAKECPDCAAPLGTYHHINCDIERMPKEAMDTGLFVNNQVLWNALENKIHYVHKQIDK